MSDCKITPTDLTVANSNLAYTASLLAGEGHSVQISYNNSYDKKELDKAVNKLNKFLEDEDTHAEYSRHKDLGTLMVKIVDDKNDKVLLEAPPEKVLDMVASLCKAVGIIDKKVWFMCV